MPKPFMAVTKMERQILGIDPHFSNMLGGPTIELSISVLIENEKNRN
jgi:hypothetical protein